MNKLVPVLIAIAVLVSIVRHVGLFPVIFLFIIGFSIYRQYKKASGKTDGKTPPWKKALDEALGQIRREMAAGSAQSQPQDAAQSEWERLAGGVDLEAEPLEVEPDKPVRAASRFSESPAAKARQQKAAIAPAPSPPPERADGHARMAPPAAAGYGVTTQAARLEELRKAVVWSEILAKPLALRGGRR